MNNSRSRDEMAMKMDECIQNCLDCHRVCLTTVPHCLNRGGEHTSQTHITSLLLKCAQLCQASACLMLIKSSAYTDVCDTCAKACERCAKECRDLANGDTKMLNCAEVCRRCAKSCAGMATATQAV